MLDHGSPVHLRAARCLRDLRRRVAKGAPGSDPGACEGSPDVRPAIWGMPYPTRCDKNCQVRIPKSDKNCQVSQKKYLTRHLRRGIETVMVRGRADRLKPGDMPTRKLSQIIRQLDTETEVSAKVKEIFEQEDVMARMIRFHVNFLEAAERSGELTPEEQKQVIDDARESAKELRAIAREFLPTRSREAEIGQTASAKAELLLELTDEELQEALESDNRKILELRQRTKTA